jgi:hypothetical protein
MGGDHNDLYLHELFTPYRLCHIERLLEHDIEALAQTRKPEGPFVGSDGLDAIMQEAMQRAGEFLKCEIPSCEYRLFDEQALPMRMKKKMRAMEWGSNATIGAPIILLAAGNPLAAAVAGVLSAGIIHIGRKIRTFRIEIEELRHPSFNPHNLTITFLPETREEMFGSAIHEYTHFLQYVSTTSQWLYYSKPLGEGHARGVTRNIMKSLWDGGPAWMHEIHDKDVGELKSVYRWASAYHKWPMSETLLSAVSTRDKEEGYHLDTDGLPTKHAIGNAIFRLYEQEAGLGIYADMMRASSGEKG